MFGLLAAVLCAPPASAGPRPDSIFEAAAMAPADADLLVVVDHAAKIRRGPAGDAWRAIAGAALDLSQTLRAWKGLAEALDLPQQEAFDALLGQRVVVCARRTGEAAPRPMAWALLMIVEPETARRLSTRLKVAPREIVAGLPVLSLERGSFELAIKRIRRRAIVVMAPAGEAGLLDPIAAVLSKNDRRPLIKTPAYAAFVERVNARSAAGLVFSRLSEVDGWAGAIAEPRGRTLRIREVGRLGPARPWPAPASADGWRALGDDALLWFLELAPTKVAKVRTPFYADIIATLNLPDDLQKLIGDRVGAVVRQAPDGGLDVAAGAQTVSVERIAPLLDGLMGRLSLRLSRMRGAEPGDVQPPDFGGLFPGALRTVEIDGPAAGDHAGPLWPLFGDDLRLIWTYQGAPEGEGGWAVVSTDAPLLEALGRAAESQDEKPARRRWLTIAAARPRALVELLVNRGVPLFGPLAAVRWIERVELSSWMPEPGWIEGRIAIEFAADRE